MTWAQFLDFLRMKVPAGAAGHMEEVVHQKDRVVQGAAQMHDVVRDFVHGINADRQREIARRGE